MAISYNDGKFVSLDAVDLTPWLVDLEIIETASLVDVSTQGVANKKFARGKPSYRFVATFIQDTALAAVDATIRANLSSSFAGIFKDKAAANIYTGPVAVGDYTVTSSGRGDDFNEISVTFEPAGAIVVT